MVPRKLKLPGHPSALANKNVEGLLEIAMDPEFSLGENVSTGRAYTLRVFSTVPVPVAESVNVYSSAEEESGLGRGTSSEAGEPPELHGTVKGNERSGIDGETLRVQELAFETVQFKPTQPALEYEKGEEPQSTGLEPLIERVVVCSCQPAKSGLAENDVMLGLLAA
jgi:hypothetical protein